MTDIFNEEKPREEGEQGEQTPALENTDTYLSLIVNEKGEQKYATAEEALKGSVHAQSHISKLETELQELRDKSKEADGVERILEALKGKPVDKSGEQTPVGITADDVASQVEQLLDARNTETTLKANIATVAGVFKKLYGEKASETMYGKANDLGFSQDEINSMIATNPNATLKILGVEKSAAVQSDPLASNGHVLALSDGKPTEKPKTIMGATNSKDLTEAWKISKEATNKRLGGVEIL